jgi:hypothetical protein
MERREGKRIFEAVLADQFPRGRTPQPPALCVQPEQQDPTNSAGDNQYDRLQHGISPFPQSAILPAKAENLF